MSHIPVLLNEVRELFREVKRPVNNIMDGTFGRGGHTRALLADWPEATVHAFDQDEEAIRSAETAFASEIGQGRLKLYHLNFAHFKEAIVFPLDLILLDLGVSSPQLDQSERGFSFYHDGPLDMRMDQRQKASAAELINSLDEKDLVDIFKIYGEVDRPFKVAREIVHVRKTQAITRTKQLADLIERVDGWQKKGMHPATKYFMALRIKVNRELEVIETVLPDLISALSEGGVLGVISFHSLEDRIVKNLLRDNEMRGTLLPRKAVQATEAESKSNPRSRSAKLRGFRREQPQPKNKYWQHSKVKNQEEE